MEKQNGTPRLTVFGKIDRVVLEISRWISYIVGASILIIMLLALFNVIATKLFRFSIPSSTEWITYLNILAVFPAVAFVQLDRGHTRVDLFDDRFPKVVRKLIEVFSDLLGAVVCGLLSWRSFVLFQEHLRKGAMSSSSALTKGAFPLWPFSLALSVFCALWLLTFLWSVIRVFLKSEDPPEEAGQDKGGDSL